MRVCQKHPIIIVFDSFSILKRPDTPTDISQLIQNALPMSIVTDGNDSSVRFLINMSKFSIRYMMKLTI